MFKGFFVLRIKLKIDAERSWWRRALGLRPKRKTVTHTVTSPQQVWTPEFEHPNCRSLVYLHAQPLEGDEPEWQWPYDCHRHGHRFSPVAAPDGTCFECCLPWWVENPVIAAAICVNESRKAERLGAPMDAKAELMYRSAVRMSFGSPPVVPV